MGPNPMALIPKIGAERVGVLGPGLGEEPVVPLGRRGESEVTHSPPLVLCLRCCCPELPAGSYRWWQKSWLQASALVCGKASMQQLCVSDGEGWVNPPPSHSSLPGQLPASSSLSWDRAVVPVHCPRAQFLA